MKNATVKIDAYSDPFKSIIIPASFSKFLVGSKNLLLLL